MYASVRNIHLETKLQNQNYNDNNSSKLKAQQSVWIILGCCYPKSVTRKLFTRPCRMPNKQTTNVIIVIFSSQQQCRYFAVSGNNKIIIALGRVHEKQQSENI